jgi:hypothetical protein
MSITVKFLSSEKAPVAVKVHRPDWQQFLHY